MMPRVECPKCAEWVNVTADDFGRMVNCGSCDAMFPAIEPQQSEDEYERQSERDEAARLLWGPSRALVKLSIVSLIASCLFGAGYFALGLSEFRIFGGNNNAADSFMLLGILTAILGSIYCLLILIGASRMHDPRQRNWPIVSAILAVAAILVCLPLPVFNLLLCIYGIRALRRLYHPAVKEAAGCDWDRERSADTPDKEQFPRAGTEEAPGFAGYFRDGFDSNDREVRDAVTAEARRRTRVPGMGLMVTGIVGMAAAFILGLIVTVNQIDDRTNAAWNAIVSFGTFTAIAFYYFLIAAGGRALSELRSRTLCYTAATLAVIGIGFCGVWLVLPIPSLIFGTWAFSALNSREVRHAMRWKKQERRDNHFV